MKKGLDKKAIKELIKNELPDIMEKDREVTELILHLSSLHFANKQETESNFDRILHEIQLDRIEQKKRWEENVKQWAENQKKWEANEKQWAENQKKWEANEKHWEANEKQWAENQKQWEENNRQWRENQRTIQGMLEEIKALHKKYDQGIGALGARWGLHAESSFRNGLAAILGGSFNVKVLHINEFDDKGEVFGRPDQVELDLIIKNGLLIICEIKSSVSRADVYIFNKKIKFYESLHNCNADRKIIISPMIEDKAKEYSIYLGMEYYSYIDEIKEDSK